MTTFAQMQSLVIAQTRRPEITDVTDAAIKSATLRAHHADFFPRDLNIGTLSYTANGSIFYDFSNVSSSLSRLRSIKSVQSVDSITFAPVEALEYRDSDDIYDSDGNRRGSVYTLIGDTLRIYPVSATGATEVHYYKNPDVASGTYASWIADIYAEELAMWAAAIVFARTGFAEMANQFNRDHIIPFKELLISSHLLGAVS